MELLETLDPLGVQELLEPLQPLESLRNQDYWVPTAARAPEFQRLQPRSSIAPGFLWVLELLGPLESLELLELLEPLEQLLHAKNIL